MILFHYAQRSGKHVNGRGGPARKRVASIGPPRQQMNFGMDVALDLIKFAEKIGVRSRYQPNLFTPMTIGNQTAFPIRA
jgi:hypothetical protein